MTRQSVEKILVKDERTPWFSIHSAYDEMPLTLEAFRVLGHLSRRAANEQGKAYPSYATIGEKCFRASYPKSTPATLRRKAIKAIKELEGFGLIRKEIRPKEDGNHATNVYVLTHSSDWNIDFDDSPNQRNCKGFREKGGSAGGTLPGDEGTPGGGSAGQTLGSADGTLGRVHGTPKGIPLEVNPLEVNPSIPPSPQGDLFNQDGGSKSKTRKNTTGQKDQLGDTDVIRILEAYNEYKPQLWAPHSTEKIKSRRTPATKLYNLFEDMDDCLEAIKFALLWAETHPQYSRREPWNKGTSDETWFNAGLTALTYKGRLADWSELGEQHQLDRALDNPDAGLSTSQQIGRQLKRLKRSGWLSVEWEQRTGYSFASELSPEQQEEYLAELRQEPDPPPQESIPVSGKPVPIPALGQSLTERRSA